MAGSSSLIYFYLPLTYSRKRSSQGSSSLSYHSIIFYYTTPDILRQNQNLLETIATQLLETEVIEGEKLHSLLYQVRPLALVPNVIS